jgi:hypothetical protein
MSVLKSMGLLAIAAGSASLSSAGTIVTVPPGLAPGSQYRLVLVTADTYTATSSSIADYNSDVNTEANAVSALAAVGTTWLAIGSTATVNAIDNIGIDSGVPIYDLEGNLVANDAGTGAGGLFGAGTGAGGFFGVVILHAIDTTELGEMAGTLPSGYVWTGSTPAGVESPSFSLGAPDYVEFGALATDGYWVSEGVIYSPGLSLPLYGISEVLTAPESATPEPSTTGMVLVAGALLYLARRINRSRRVTRTNR